MANGSRDRLDAASTRRPFGARAGHLRWPWRDRAYAAFGRFNPLPNGRQQMSASRICSPPTTNAACLYADEVLHIVSHRKPQTLQSQTRLCSENRLSFNGLAVVYGGLAHGRKSPRVVVRAAWVVSHRLLEITQGVQKNMTTAIGNDSANQDAISQLPSPTSANTKPAPLTRAIASGTLKICQSV